MLCRRQHWWIGGLLAFVLIFPVEADDTIDACVWNLKQAITTQRNGSHLPRLTALRHLADPASKALFESLLVHQDWQIQVHALLALAELEDPKRIDPNRIDQLDPLAQNALIANGIDLQLFDVAGLNQLAINERLSQISRLLVMGELLLLGEPVPNLVLEAWSSDESLRIAAMASCLLAKLGHPEVLNAFVNQLSGLSRNEQVRNLLLVLEAIRQYKITPAVEWILSVLDSSPHREVAYRAVLTLLELDLSKGLVAWRDRLGENPSHSQSVRYGLLLLAADVEVPASTFNAIETNGDELLEAIVALGKARSAHEGESQGYVNLLRQEHRRSVDWAMSSLERADQDMASDVYRSLLDQLVANPKIQSLATALAVRAASELVKLHLDEMLDRLKRAEDDGALQQLIMLAMFDLEDVRIGMAAQELRRIGSGRADSLTLLLMAKHLPKLSVEDLEALGLIVASGGGVSIPLQTQASWFFLKQSGLLEPTLTTILDEQ